MSKAGGGERFLCYHADMLTVAPAALSGVVLGVVPRLAIGRRGVLVLLPRIGPGISAGVPERPRPRPEGRDPGRSVADRWARCTECVLCCRGASARPPGAAA